jgi:antitoxin component YwqK of YwqJK toxin-antitoxin module
MIYLSRLLGVVLLLSVAISCKAQNSEEKSEIVIEMVNYSELEFRNVEQEQLAYFKNELFTGWSVIFTKGQIKYIEQQYLNGKKDGIWRVYYPSGQLQKEGNMVNGLDEGLYREYYENGTLQYEYHYSAGKKVGKWLSWYADGTPYTERNFVNDELNGKVLVWDEKGKLAKEYDYRNNILVNSIMHFKNTE